MSKTKFCIAPTDLPRARARGQNTLQKEENTMEKSDENRKKLKTENEPIKKEKSVDPYEGYDRDNPPPWLDEFEYIDFMITH